MTLAFFILAVMVLGGAAAAMTMRKLVHGVLWLVVSLGGLACLYLGLGAQFVGLAQLLVYVGAVVILVAFAILLTRSEGVEIAAKISPSWLGGLLTSGAVGVALLWAIARSQWLETKPSGPLEPSVREIGDHLMTTHIVPLEAIGALLTAALIGAVILAMREGRPK
jgi:NADH-quinone oxidoreductase subunit J